MRPVLSVVLPCYNEAGNIPSLVARFVEVRLQDLPLEVILVDNGSTDNSAAVIAKCLSEERYACFARSVRIAKNEGYGHGIWFGLQHAGGDYLAWSHADMQSDPRDIIRAFEKLISVSDHSRVLVKGARKRRSVGAEFLTFGMQLCAQLVLWQPLRDINAQPKVFHRTLLEYLPHPPKDLSFDLYVLYKALNAGWRIDTIPVVFGKRLSGQSKWAFNLTSKLSHIAAAIRYMIKLRFAEG